MTARDDAISSSLAPAAPPDVDADAWDAFVDTNPLGSYLQLSGWARVKAVNGWRVRRLLDPADPRVGVQVLLRRPGPLPWAFAYAPRGPVLDAWDGASVGRLTTLVRDGLRAGPRVSHLRIDPEVERRAGPDARHRPHGRRGCAVGRPAQEVAPVRQQGPRGGRARRGRRPRASRRVLPHLPRDRRPGGVPDPRPVGVRGRVGRVRAGGSRPPAVRGAPRRHTGRHAVPGP